MVKMWPATGSMARTSRLAWRIWTECSASIIASSFLGQEQVQRHHVAAREHLSERGEFNARKGPPAAVPGDHLQAGTEREARDLGRDAAEPDETERLAGELDALDAESLATNGVKANSNRSNS
jgi:hypothetical protein